MFKIVCAFFSYDAVGYTLLVLLEDIRIYFSKLMFPYMYVHVLRQENRKQVKWDQTPKTPKLRRYTYFL